MANYDVTTYSTGIKASIEEAAETLEAYLETLDESIRIIKSGVEAIGRDRQQAVGWCVHDTSTSTATTQYGDQVITGDLTVHGSVSAGLPRVVKAATGSLSVADLRGCLVSNKGQTDDATISLPAIAEGMHCLVCLETTVAKYWRLDPNASEVIIFDGTTLTGGYYVGIASAVDGAMLSVVARYAETTLVWDIKTIEGTWAAQV